MITPVNDKVVVKREPLTAPTDVSTTLVIPDTALARSKFARVVSVGKGVKENINKGDRVAITWHVGTKYDDKDLGEVEVLLETEILAVIT